MNSKHQSRSAVYVVDDDASVRNSLSSLFRSVDFSVESFSSPANFLKHDLADVPSCMILDVRMPGLSGLDFQTKLIEAGIEMPIVFLTGRGDIQMSVRAMKSGAIDFLTKPYREQDILDAVTTAIERDRKRRENRRLTSGIRACFETLSRREKEAMSLLASGLMNKQVAEKMGLAEITVKIHRGNVMRKMRAKSFAELVKMSEALGVSESIYVFQT
jgi:FixJ family two-component response regulator